MAPLLTIIEKIFGANPSFHSQYGTTEISISVFNFSISNLILGGGLSTGL